MKVFKTFLAVGSEIHTMDTIEYEGGFWLVPNWILSPDDQYMKPLLIVSLATIPHTESPEGVEPRFVVNSPIPKSVFQGVIPEGKEGQFVIVQEPHIVFPNPDKAN